MAGADPADVGRYDDTCISFREISRPGDCTWKNKRDAAEFLIFSFFGMTLCQYSYFMAIQHSNAGVATVLRYGAALILIYVCLRARRKPRIYETGALILSLSGTFILATHGDVTTMALSRSELCSGV